MVLWQDIWPPVGHPDDARGNSCAGDRSALFTIPAQAIPTSDSNDTMGTTEAMMTTGGRNLVRSYIVNMNDQNICASESSHFTCPFFTAFGHAESPEVKKLSKKHVIWPKYRDRPLFTNFQFKRIRTESPSARTDIQISHASSSMTCNNGVDSSKWS